MNQYTRGVAIALLAGATLVGTGCAVMRDQQSVGGYVDDSVLLTKIKAKMLDDPAVSGMAVNVDAMNGTVLLSGFAKSPAEKARAEMIARSVEGVRVVRNNLVVRP